MGTDQSQPTLCREQKRVATRYLALSLRLAARPTCDTPIAYDMTWATTLSVCIDLPSNWLCILPSVSSRLFDYQKEGARGDEKSGKKKGTRNEKRGRAVSKNPSGRKSNLALDSISGQDPIQPRLIQLCCKKDWKHLHYLSKYKWDECRERSKQQKEGVT